MRKCMAEYLFPKISLQQVQFITKFAVPIFGRGSKYRFLVKLTEANDKRKAGQLINLGKRHSWRLQNILRKTMTSRKL